MDCRQFVAMRGTGYKVLAQLIGRALQHTNATEVVLWVGVAIIARPVLRGWQWVTLISPVFMTLLLTRISGVPMLENRADDR